MARRILIAALHLALPAALAAEPLPCLDCHGEILQGAVVHAAAKDGDCSGCHVSDDGDHPFHLTAESVGKVCEGCHGDPAEGRRVVHGPVASGACTACHDPHSSRQSSLLRRAGNELCEECHLAGRSGTEGAPRFALSAEGIGHPTRRHPTRGVPDPFRPGESLGCTTCHEPHGSARGALLARADSASLCGPCHSKTRPRPPAAPESVSPPQ